MSGNQPTILIYAPGRPAWLGKLRGALTPQGVRLRAVAPEELDRPVGVLAGLPGFEAGEAGQTGGSAVAEAVPEPVLVLCHLPGARLDTVLQILRRAGVSRGVLKAVLTETNASWTLRALYGELCEERRALSGDPDARPQR